MTSRRTSGEDDRHGLAALARRGCRLEGRSAALARPRIRDVVGAAIGTDAAGFERAAARDRTDPGQTIGRDRGTHALRDERLDRLAQGGFADEVERRRVDEDLHRGGVLLHRRRQLECRAGQDMLTLGRLADDDLPCRDPGSCREPDPPRPIEVVVQLDQCPLRRRCRPDGTDRVIRIGSRQPEHRDDRIADDLLDRPAVRFENDPHLVEIAGQHLTQGLGVKLLTEAGRALQVGRDDRDDPPDLIAHKASLRPPPCDGRRPSGVRTSVRDPLVATRRRR